MKTKAFTILEALISLILISIIIGLIFSVLTLVGKQVLLFSNEGNAELTYNLFDTTLQRDIQKAHDFNVYDNQIILEHYDETTITYLLSKTHILRNNEISIDTFKLNVIDYAIQDRYGKDSYNKIVTIKVELFNDTIKANYFLDKNKSQIINNTFYYED